MKIISLFAGAGGMDLGFIQAGFEIIWANDFNSDAVETYKKNIGNHIILGDITKISSSEIPGDVGDIDVVIGGFPCQGFSIANNNRSMEDQRNFLYLEMLRVIKDKQPKFFVAENVKGILSIEKGKVIETIVKDFKEIGYEVDYKLVNAADYGVPQARERVIIIGNRIGITNPFPIQTHADLYPGEDNYAPTSQSLYSLGSPDKKLPYVTVEETIGYLSDVELQNGKVEDFIIANGEKIYNHIASTSVSDKFWGRKYEVNQHEICDYLKEWRAKAGLSTKKIDEYFGYKHTAGHWFRKDNNSGSIPKPSDWWKLKELLGFDDKYDEVVTTFVEKDIKFEQSLRITNWNRASDTITATSPEIHINKQRRLSVRECAMLQTFPNDFIFTGSLNSQYRQVGNAVPVKLAQKIALKIKKALEKSKKREEMLKMSEMLSNDEREKLKKIEELEYKYLKKYYYFLKFAEDEMFFGFRTKEAIKEDWIAYYGTEISDFAVGAERIIYSLLNGKGIGQPNSSPVGSDLFFEIKDAYIHIDLKTVEVNNIGDFTSSIFIGENQNSYKGKIKKTGNREEDYNPSLPTYYNKGKDNEKICLTYFITILYEKTNLDIYVITIDCMPNGELEKYYGSRVLAAGKNPGKARFKRSEVNKFELLDDKPNRIQVVYFNKEMPDAIKDKLKLYEELNEELS